MLALTLSLLLSQAPTVAPTKLELAREGWELTSKSYGAGTVTIEQVVVWSARLYEAEKSDPGAAQRHVDRLRDLEKRARERFNQGMASKLDVLSVSYLRAQAEDLLSKR